MDNISQIISVAGEAASNRQQDHAFLFIRTINGRSPSIVSSEEKAERDKKLRLQTSGVVVLTADDALLGNVREYEGAGEEDSVVARFRPNSSRDNKYTSSTGMRLPTFSIPQSLLEPKDGPVDLDYVLLRDPPNEGEGVLSNTGPLRRDSKGESLGIRSASQSSVPQPAPKRRRMEETYSVKRFKGATMSQIFGTDNSLSSRRL